MTANIDIFDELNYLSYSANRRMSPHVEPERWKKIYKRVDEMEARFAAENKVDTGKIK